MKMLVLVLAFLAAGCTPPYGRQSCTKPTDCTDGQSCQICSATPDAGTAATTAGLCSLPCATDADCGKLGLKKPKCATNTCGETFCIDSPF